MLTLLLFSCLLFGPAGHADSPVIATVGNRKITTEEFHRKYEEFRKQAIATPTPEQFLEELIRFEVGVQEAERLKLQNDPIVRERFQQVLYNSLLEKQIGKRLESIKVNENEMREYYKKNPELHLAHIVIGSKINAKPEEREVARRRATEVWTAVKKSKRPFEDLVRLYTDDTQTKENGGDIGFQSRMTLVPQIYDVAVGMKPGEIKGLIESPFGFHIIKMIERRGYDLADKRQLNAALMEEKRTRIFNDYFGKLKKQYKIEVAPGVLKSAKH
jgi:peptidyl-prolyl cis-trans isomerase C/peptidyl-prolyl cis-trans isomerase D